MMTITAAATRFSSAPLLALALVMGGCAAPGANTSLSSVRQPVVERSTHTLDLSAAGGELAPGEQARLDQWFTALDLGYGDRLAVAGSAAGPAMRSAVAALAARHGVLAALDTAPAADLPPGQVRILVSRSRAYVPGCPDWADKSAAALDNATSPGFGCAVNSNLAAMIADPEHLLAGARGSGETVVMSATKAIATYRALEPTGAGGLSDVSSKGDE